MEGVTEVDAPENIVPQVTDVDDTPKAPESIKSADVAELSGHGHMEGVTEKASAMVFSEQPDSEVVKIKVDESSSDNEKYKGDVEDDKILTDEELLNEFIKVYHDEPEVVKTVLFKNCGFRANASSVPMGTILEELDKVCDTNKSLLGQLIQNPDLCKIFPAEQIKFSNFETDENSLAAKLRESVQKLSAGEDCKAICNVMEVVLDDGKLVENVCGVYGKHDKIEINANSPLAMMRESVQKLSAGEGCVPVCNKVASNDGKRVETSCDVFCKHDKKNYENCNNTIKIENFGENATELLRLFLNNVYKQLQPKQYSSLFDAHENINTKELTRKTISILEERYSTNGVDISCFTKKQEKTNDLLSILINYGAYLRDLNENMQVCHNGKKINVKR